MPDSSAIEDVKDKRVANRYVNGRELAARVFDAFTGAGLSLDEIAKYHKRALDTADDVRTQMLVLNSVRRWVDTGIKAADRSAMHSNQFNGGRVIDALSDVIRPDGSDGQRTAELLDMQDLDREQYGEDE